MPDNDKKSHPITEGLMDRRTVFLNGKITTDLIGEIADRLVTLQMKSSDPIKLLINSGGGGVPQALQLCDLIGSVLTAPVHGIALGACGSAATFVMLHCAKRMSTPYSRFLIHSGTRSEIAVPINQSSSEHLEQLLKEVRNVEEIVTRLYMERLTPMGWRGSKPNEAEQRVFVQGLITRGDQPFDQWLSAENAIEIGLIEEITTAKLDIFAVAKTASEANQ